MLLGTINNINKNTERKRVLQAANFDYLEVPNKNVASLSDVSIVLNSEYEVKAGVGESLFVWGNFTTEDTVWIYQSDVTFVFAIYKGGGVSEQYSVNLPLGSRTLYFDFNNLELRVDNILVKTFSNINMSGLSTATQNPNISRYLFAGQYCDQNIINFSLNDETFSLNEGNGATFTGSNGTVGTCLTGHSGDLNYINQEMIQDIYGSGVQRKRVLTSANSDYLEVYDNNVVWTNFSDADFEVLVDIDNYIGDAPVVIFGQSGNNDTGVCVIRCDLGRNKLRLVIGGKNNVGIKGYEIPITLGNNLLTVTNGSVSVNGNIILTPPDLVIDVDSSFSNTGLGGYTHQIAPTLAGAIFNFRVNNETFSLNEGNGATFKGSLGTIGTCNTGHSGGLNYINQEMIKPI